MFDTDECRNFKRNFTQKVYSSCSCAPHAQAQPQLNSTSTQTSELGTTQLNLFFPINKDSETILGKSM